MCCCTVNLQPLTYGMGGFSSSGLSDMMHYVVLVQVILEDREK